MANQNQDVYHARHSTSLKWCLNIHFTWLIALISTANAVHFKVTLPRSAKEAETNILVAVATKISSGDQIHKSGSQWLPNTKTNFMPCWLKYCHTISRKIPQGYYIYVPNMKRVRPIV